MFTGKNVKLGIAPIAWTNDDLPELGGENTFQQCVSEMALAGFTGSEVGNKYPKDPAVLKPIAMWDCTTHAFAGKARILTNPPKPSPPKCGPSTLSIPRMNILK